MIPLGKPNSKAPTEGFHYGRALREDSVPQLTISLLSRSRTSESVHERGGRVGRERINICIDIYMYRYTSIHMAVSGILSNTSVVSEKSTQGWVLGQLAPKIFQLHSDNSSDTSS